MALLCDNCNKNNINILRSGTNVKLCKDCYIEIFEEEVYKTIKKFNLIIETDVVGIGVSGGKDSIALLNCLCSIKKKKNLNWNLKIIAIDEGISGYRDHSIEYVNRAIQKYELESIILSFSELFDGWTMDKIHQKIGNKHNCTYCGIFRRQALEIGGRRTNCTCIATGHNADDSIETMLLNLIRGDKNRYKSVGVTTGCICGNKYTNNAAGIAKIKPFYYMTQKDIVLYCRYLSLDYFSVECKYSAYAFRGDVREYIRKLDSINPKIIRNILFMFPTNKICKCKDERDIVSVCKYCNMIGKEDGCNACKLVKNLNKTD